MSVNSASSTAASVTRDRPSASISDLVLLDRFLDQQDEVAFAAIVQRYASMVLAVALRVLRDRHAAEDVLQATFFILAREGRKLRRREALAAWLHGIALRISRKALMRRQRMRPLESIMEPVVEAPLLKEMCDIFEQQLLDEELEKLPEHYREPLILHFLQGRTYEETARALGTTVGAIEGRIKRGKRELHLRLMRRGVELTAVFTAITWSQSAAQAAVHSDLISTVVQGAGAVIQGTAFAPTCSSEAVHLATQEATMFTVSKITVAALGLLAATGAGWVSRAGVQDGLPGDGTNGGEVAAIGEGVQGDASQPSMLGLFDSIPIDPAVYSFAGSVLSSSASSEAELAAGEEPKVTGDGQSTAQVEGTVPGPAPFDSTVSLKLNGGAPQSGDGDSSAAPKILVGRNLRPSEKKIEEELGKTVSIGMPGFPLNDVVTHLAKLHQIPIRIDEQVLEDAGVAIDSEVTLEVKEISLESALNLLLENVNGVPLTYVIQNEMLTITTAEAADEKLETRIYDVRPLNLSDPTALIQAIQQSTEGPWQDIDGVGGGISPLMGQLVIRQTQSMHRETERLLNNLLTALSQGTGEVPDWPVNVGGFGPTRGSGRGFGGADGEGFGGAGGGGNSESGNNEGGGKPTSGGGFF